MLICTKINPLRKFHFCPYQIIFYVNFTQGIFSCSIFNFCFVQTRIVLALQINFCPKSDIFASFTHLLLRFSYLRRFLCIFCLCFFHRTTSRVSIFLDFGDLRYFWFLLFVNLRKVFSNDFVIIQSRVVLLCRGFL